VALYLPAGLEHAVRVTGKDSVKAVQIYSPAGPEARFKAWPQQAEDGEPGL
jgi:hypothetical protein